MTEEGSDRQLRASSAIASAERWHTRLAKRLVPSGIEPEDLEAVRTASQDRF
jgi:hypothetical protein